MSPLTMLLAIFSFLVLPIWAQDDPPVNPDNGHENEFSDFRHNCSTADLDGTTLTAPCQELCSYCPSRFYLSTIDLNKCIGYDGADTLVPCKDGNYGNVCPHCFTNWAEPDILHCSCNGMDGQMHDVSIDMNMAVGTRCGRLSCQGFTNDLGAPIGTPDPYACNIQTDIPSGARKIAQPTAGPDLLYIRRGIVHRQFPQTNSTSTTSSASVLITLTPQPLQPGGAVNTGTVSAPKPQHTEGQLDEE